MRLACCGTACPHWEGERQLLWTVHSGLGGDGMVVLGAGNMEVVVW